MKAKKLIISKQHMKGDKTNKSFNISTKKIRGARQNAFKHKKEGSSLISQPCQIFSMLHLSELKKNDRVWGKTRSKDEQQRAAKVIKGSNSKTILLPQATFNHPNAKTREGSPMPNMSKTPKNSCIRTGPHVYDLAN